MYVTCNPDLCFGCLTCVTACLAQRYDAAQTDAIPPRLHLPRAEADSQYITKSCLHCQDALCLAACPAGAIWRDAQGFVCVEEESCTGCRKCAAACPHDIPRFAKSGKMVKCDGCTARLAYGLKPVCLSICPAGALGLEE